VKRALTGIAITLAIILIVPALYLALTDFSEYRTNIEEAVTEATGREFRIDGEFTVEAFPPSLIVEKVSFANADWGADTPMVSVGHLSARIVASSLFSGPTRIDEFRLRDVEIFLEENAAGENNWSIENDQPEVYIPPQAQSGVPLILEFAEIENIRITRRRPDIDDRVLKLASLNVRTTNERYLAAEGTGQLDDRALSLNGSVGPIDNFQSGSDLDLNLETDFGVMSINVSGNTGNPRTLADTEIQATVISDDVAAIFALLEVPSDLSGALRVEATLSADNGQPAIALDASLGGLDVNGTALLADEQINFDVSVSSLSQLGDIAGVSDLPEGPASAQGGVIVDGDSVEIIDVTLETSLATVVVSANTSISAGQIKLDPFSLQIGDSDISGSLDVGLADPVSISGDLHSKLLDLTPFIGDEEAEPESQSTGGDYVFSDEPLPFDFLNAGSADLELLVETFRQGPLALEQLQGSLKLNDGALNIKTGFSVTDGGNASADVSLVSRGDSADVEIKLDISELRFSLSTSDAQPAVQSPLIGLSTDVRSSGGSLRALASNAIGKVLFTQGPGQVDNSALGLFSADIVAQLFSALNPFAKKEPYTIWECTVFALNIVDGVSTIEPMLAQSEKVTIVGSGSINFNDESLDIRFNTKPRRGVGVSANMFVTPFVMLGGTMSAPRLALDKTGVLISGGAAVLTGGISLLVKGAADRASGASDRCAAALALAKGQDIDTED
jgi:uncharacterized protein involved in outer membrane biogenesis